MFKPARFFPGCAERLVFALHMKRVAAVILWSKPCTGQKWEPALWEEPQQWTVHRGETETETHAGGLRDQRQPEGIAGHFLCFVPSPYVPQKCSDRQSHMWADRQMENKSRSEGRPARGEGGRQKKKGGGAERQSKERPAVQPDWELLWCVAVSPGALFGTVSSSSSYVTLPGGPLPTSPGAPL